MKRLTIIITALLLYVAAAMAVPAYSGICQIKQPDGSTLSIRLIGDEYLSFHTTADGYTIVKNTEGWYVYAEKHNGELVATTRKAHDEAQRTTEEKAWLESIGQWLKPEMSEDVISFMKEEAESRNQARSRRTAKAGRYDYSNFKGLVILVQYNDCSFSRSDYPTLIDNMLNQKDYRGYDDTELGQYTGSVRDYFYDNSLGMFEPSFVVKGPVTVNYSQFAAHDPEKEILSSTMIRPMVLDALESLDSEIDFSEYDGDKDGVVDMVYFIFAGCASSRPDNNQRLLWPHKSSIREIGLLGNLVLLEKDGVTFGSYACSTELAGSEKQSYIDGIGTICHEFSHVLGLPDLYDTNYGEDGLSNHPSDWSVMASGSYLNNSRTPAGYGLLERYLAGFATPQLIESESNYQLKPISESNQGYRINSGAEKEFFLLENRQQTAKWDAYLPGHGLLVFRTEKLSNAGIWEDGDINANFSHNYYEMVRAGGGWGATASDPFPGTEGVTSLTNSTYPANLLSWEGKPTQMVLTNIAETDGSISFSLTDVEKLGGNDNPDVTFGSSSVIYWFDDMKELAGRLERPASVFMLDVSELSDGLHALHIAVSGTNSDDEYVEEGARTVYFEKHGQEAEITTHYFIDGVEHTTIVSTTDNDCEFNVTMETVNEGFYRLTTVMEHTGTGRITTREDYFARELTDKELGAQRIECSINGVKPTTLLRGFTDGVLEYDLDVSEMPSGMHTLAYRVVGTISTPLKRDIFLIDPKVESYQYWLNGDRTTGVEKGKLKEGTPWELDTAIPVGRMPLRTNAYEFNVEEGIPVTYTINDFTMRVTTDNGGFDESVTVQYVDEASRTPVDSDLLAKNKTTKMTAPAEGELKWLYLKGGIGDMIGLQSSRQCTIHIYAPDGEELLIMSGKKSTSGSEIKATQNGTYYVAIHDISDEGSITELSITCDYAENVIKGDAYRDGSIDVADIVTIINYIMGDPSEEFNFTAADLDNDDDVTIFDVIQGINLVLSYINAEARNMARSTNNTDEIAFVSATADGILLDINDPARFTAFQFDVEVPDGVEFTGARLNANALHHKLYSLKTGQNTYRVVGVSMDNNTLTADSNGLIELVLSKGGNVRIDNILFVTPQETKVHFVGGDATVTGIGIVIYHQTDEIYDLSGRKIDVERSQLPKGVYIINNKKVIIK